MERRGETSAEQATRWKQGVFGLMVLRDLELGDVTSV
jgi:hypothetical protein